MGYGPAATLAGLALLLAGAPPARGSEPPREAVLAEIPFGGSASNRVIVDLAPEGSRKPFPLFLDTGADWSVITPRMARDLGVKVRRLKDSPYRRETRLGRDLQFWIDDRSSDTASKTGWEYGLLGGQFLAEYVVEIDFPGRRVRFLDRGKYEVPERAEAPAEAVLPMKLVSNRPAVEIRVEGKPMLVALDTGAPPTAILSGKALRKAGVAWQAILELTGGSVLGPMDLELAELAELRLGPFAFGPGAPILVAPKGWYNIGIESESVIGFDLLAPFVVRLDYPRRRLWLRRVREDPITLYGVDYAAARRSGVLLEWRQDLYFADLVFPGGEAERHGLRSGDAIESIAGEAAPASRDAIARAIAEGREISVRRHVGGEWEVVTLSGVAPATPPVSSAGEE
jgi:hypothetical protein